MTKRKSLSPEEKQTRQRELGEELRKLFSERLGVPQRLLRIQEVDLMAGMNVGPSIYLRPSSSNKVQIANYDVHLHDGGVEYGVGFWVNHVPQFKNVYLGGGPPNSAVMDLAESMRKLIVKLGAEPAIFLHWSTSRTESRTLEYPEKPHN